MCARSLDCEPEGTSPDGRDGLTGMFAADPGFEVLGEAADGAEAVRLAQALGPT